MSVLPVQPLPMEDAPGERAIEALVTQVLGEPALRHLLVAALPEASPYHAQVSRTATARMRGWMLASFEQVGLPDDAIAFVLEELQSGSEAYLVAAAARAVRGRPRPEPLFAPHLVRAILNIQGRDDLLSFAAYGATALPGNGTTAIRELIATLRWMGSAARVARPELEALLVNADALCRADHNALKDCLRALAPSGEAEGEDTDCCAPLRIGCDASDGVVPGDAVRAIELEDQQGSKARFDEVFVGHPSIVVFFYSRCDNPRKCSLTVSKVARVQRMLAEQGLLDRIATAAVTYDPGFDGPERLLVYGKARAWVEHPLHRLLRSTTSGDVLGKHFRLGVSFIASLVNRHRIECFVLDADGKIRRSFTRLQWDESEVLAAAKELLPQAAPAPVVPAKRSLGRAVLSLLPAALLAFFPRCPMCWAAYMSMLGVAGLERIPYSPWLLPVFMAMLGGNLFSLWRRSGRQRTRVGFWLSASGAALILVGGILFRIVAASWTGVLLTLAGSLLGVSTSVFKGGDIASGDAASLVRLLRSRGGVGARFAIQKRTMNNATMHR